MFYKVFCKYNDYFSIFAPYNKKNMQQSSYIIEVQNVSKYFGEKVALDNSLNGISLIISMVEDVKGRGGSGYVVKKDNLVLEERFGSN